MIGIIGLGSIGQRHARSLAELGEKDIIALRTGRGVMKTLPTDLSFITETDNEEHFYQAGLDGVIISNPTSLHLESARSALSNDIPVFIEKPLTESFEKAQILQPFSQQLLVGYCFRFAKHIRLVKEFIEHGRLGKLFKASFYRSYYLPKWHPYADYRLEYTAQKKLGGGVIRTLSHEIDLMHFLFGTPGSVQGVVDKVSDLEIDTDDFCFFTCKMKDGARVNFELDFLSPENINRADFIGSEGRLSYDANGVVFTPMEGDSQILHETAENDLNQMYLDQMQDFLKFIAMGESMNCRFDDAVSTLKIISEIEKI